MMEQVAAGRVRSREGVYWYVDDQPAARQYGRTLRELRAAGMFADGAEPADQDNVTPVTLSEAGRVALYGPAPEVESPTSTDAVTWGDVQA